MSRRTLNDGQEVIFQDINDLQALKEQELYDRVIFEMLQRVENAFFQDSFKGIFLDATHVNINAGLGVQTDNTVADTEPTKRLIYSDAAQPVTLDDPDGSNDRIDLIVVKTTRVVNETDTRKYKATIGGSVTSTLFNVRSDWASDLQAVTGTPGLSPVAPAVPSGYIKLAEILVHAVTGVTGQGDITDTRDMLPVGGDVVVNTTGYVRIPSGASTPLSTALAAIDTFLKFGYQNYTDFDDLGSDPAAPGATKNRLYFKAGVAYFKDSSNVITPIGSGGGGGGGANWYPGAIAPTDDTENGERVWIFSDSDAGSQKLTLFVRVPSGFVAGRQISMYLGSYSPSTSNAFKLKTVTTLVRKNNDAISSVANQYTSTNAALTNTVANQYREELIDLTNATGQINGFSVNPGDLLKVELSRDSGDTDTADVRMMPSSTEVKFG